MMGLRIKERTICSLEDLDLGIQGVDQLKTIGVVSGGYSERAVLLRTWRWESRVWISSRLLELYLEAAVDKLSSWRPGTRSPGGGSAPDY